MKAVFFYQREQTKASLCYLASFSLIYDRGSIRHQRVPRVVHQAPEVVPNREKAWRLPNLELISLAPLLCEKHLGKCSDRETHSFVGLKLQLAQFTSLPVPHLCSLQSYGMTKLLQASTAVLWLILSATGLRLANISFTTNFQSISQYGAPTFLHCWVCDLEACFTGCFKTLLVNVEVLFLSTLNSQQTFLSFGTGKTGKPR